MTLTVGALASHTRTAYQALTPDRPPQLSMLLPTYNSVDGAELRAVLDSVLGQSMDLELIVVDDASTDNTLDVLLAAARDDGRVTVMAHEHNVGLPAISVWEAYLASRAETVGFAFHDTVFTPLSLARAVSELGASGAQALFTAVEWTLVDAVTGRRRQHLLKPRPRELSFLSNTNLIGNSGAFLTRGAIEHVGLFDPHVLMSRLCDWDLWRRLISDVPAEFAPWVSSVEGGTVRTTSLGNSYPLRARAVRELQRYDRSGILTPGRMAARDVAWVPPGASQQFRTAVAESVERHWARGWSSLLGERSTHYAATSDTPSGVKAAHSEPASINILGRGLDPAPSMFAGPSASISEGLITDRPMTVLSPLSGIRAVVLSRSTGGPDVERALRTCCRAGIQTALLWDDNPLMLPGFGGPGGVTRRPSIHDLTRIASRVDYVFVTTEAFADWVTGMGIHPNPSVWRPALAPHLLDACRRLHSNLEDDAPTRIALPGGGFRGQNPAGEAALAALSAVSVDRTWLVRTEDRESHEFAGLRHTIGIPFTGHYPAFVLTWAAQSPDLLVHLPGPTANAKFKLPSMLFAAAYWGVPILFPDEPAWRDVPHTQLTVRCSTPDDYAQGLTETLRSPREREATRAELVSIVDRLFPLQSFEQILEHLTGHTARPASRSRRDWRIR